VAEAVSSKNNLFSSFRVISRGLDHINNIYTNLYILDLFLYYFLRRKKKEGGERKKKKKKEKKDIHSIFY